MDFYLTLPSNSSMDYYPDNTVANYVTQLPRIIHLDGTWEVSVAEVFYPCSFLTIDNNSYIYISENVETGLGASNAIEVITESIEGVPKYYYPELHVCKLKPGNYTDVEEVIDMINDDAKVKQLATFNYDCDVKKVTITCEKNVTQVELTSRLALQLGFDPYETDLKKNNTSVRPANLHLGLPNHMYIYCDIAEPQFIGNSMAPLMRIVNVDTTGYLYGANKHVQFISPHYVTVMKSSFESLEIDLRTNTGEKLPFQFGTSCVKLHFRKKSE